MQPKSSRRGFLATALNAVAVLIAPGIASRAPSAPPASSPVKASSCPVTDDTEWVTTYVYDPSGNRVTSFTGPKPGRDGNVTRYVYDTRTGECYRD